MSHILVIGATGQTGIDFCTIALEAGHQLTLYVRTPTKVPATIKDNLKVSIIEGTFDNEEGLKEIASCGATIFVSFAGPATASFKGTPVTDCYKKLFPLLIEHKFQRALVLGTPSYPAPEDKGGFKWKAAVLLIKIIAGSGYQEFNGLGSFIASQDVNQIKWTLFRVGFLGNGPAKDVTAAYTGSGQDGMSISRKSIAAWVLKELGDDSAFVGKAPLISN